MPAFATAQDSQDIGQLSCSFDSFPVVGLFDGGEPTGFLLSFTPPQPIDFSDFIPTEDGQIGFFEPPGGIDFSLIEETGEALFTSAATETLFGLQQSGTGDIVAVGGQGVDGSLPGDLQIGGFSIEFLDEDADAVPTVQSWLFDYSDFELSRCAVDLVDAEGEVQFVLEGEVSIPDPDLPTGNTLEVPFGDVDALIAAIETANKDCDRRWLIFFSGERVPFVYTQPYQGTGNALPAIKSRIRFTDTFVEHKRSIAATQPFRFMEIFDNGVVEFSAGEFGSINTFPEVEDFSSPGAGGSFLVRDQGALVARGLTVVNSMAEGNGGAIAVQDSASLELTDENFMLNCSSEADGGAISFNSSGRFVVNGLFGENAAAGVGGAISVDALDGPNSKISVGFSRFGDNTAGETGAHIYIRSNEANLNPTDITIQYATFFGATSGRGVVADGQSVVLKGNTFKGANDGPGVVLNGELFLQHNILDGQNDESPNKADKQLLAPKMACQGSNSAKTSLGFNVSSDNSCSLNQASDMGNTDPMLSAPDADGLRTPLPGSPAIDIGPASVVVLPGDTLATLPCSFKDAYGLGRPQDGDGDGSFDCDAGVVEVQGSGKISAGHSAAYYNTQRNGEGFYVEIINDNLALVYVFSYRPDGSGPAWFTGIGRIVGNSIVIDEIQRPEGTSFGQGFDTDEIDFTPAGGLSFVVPNCQVNGSGGVVAFEGKEDLGYEGLLSQAERLTRVTGCNFTKAANVGLSGTFYDPGRDGEGLIAQWLGNGNVAVTFFTHGPDGRQFWVFGVGKANGKGVTINALYPAGVTSWGSGFDADEVDLQPWGTFELTWTACDTLTFKYMGQIQGFGGATRQYQRLTRLKGTSCPSF